MFHIRIFLQTLRRNITYTAINIAGLSIGIAASVLIFFWVHHERSFDTCYPDTGRIYRIISNGKNGENVWVFPSTSFPFNQACENEIPEIEKMAVMFGASVIQTVTVNHTLYSLKWGGAKIGDGVYVNRAWLEMFHPQLLDGSFEAFGAHPFSVALTESGAKKYFGGERAVGQIIRFNDADYMVQAVVKDNPSNSSFRYHLIASMDAAFSNPDNRYHLEQWGSVNATTFVKLRPNTDVSLVTQKMNNIHAKNSSSPNSETSAELELLTDMYFSDVVSRFIQGNAKMVSIFTLLGILLLCTASINYINLTTAKVTKRAKEVGVKKIVGAKSRTLFLQFINESFLVSLIAAVIALYLIVLVTPLYQQLVGDIPVSLSSSVIWIIMTVVLAFVTILNGIYPALVLSSFQPIHILKGMSLPKIKDSSIRRVLVVFQFTLSAALIVCVIVIYMQTQFIVNSDPGFRRDNIVRVQFPFGALGRENAQLDLQTIKGKLQSYPDVVSASLGAEEIEDVGTTHGWQSFDWDGRTEELYPRMHALRVDADFMDVFELQLTAGRWFDGSVDMQNVVLNETAIREYKIAEPYIGQRFYFSNLKGNIIGVVKDFHFQSRHEKITPLVIAQNPFYWSIVIKTQEGRSAEVIHEMETIWGDFFPNDPFEYTFVDDTFKQLYKSDIRTSRLMLVFSVLAIVIAVLGLFGLSTFAIERRTKEIGVRKILGASTLSIVHLLTREFLILVAIAFAIAAPLSWWAMNRWLDNFAYRIHITVWIFIFGAAITLACTLISIGVQAIKAATENPVKAIKTE